MKAIEFKQKNKAGIVLHFQHWPSPEARAVVCLVHGVGEHIGRYDHVANFFATKNVATLGFDHQGHGLSGGKRGHTIGLASMMDDVELLMKLASEAYPGRPMFLYGHSMGGNVVLNYVLRRRPNIAGTIATGPWIRLPKQPSELKVAVAQLVQLFFPNFAQANGLNLNGLSNDEAVIEAYRNDPLVHNLISVKTGYELFRGANYLDKFTGTPPCPLLLMHGENDPLTNPKGTADFANRNPTNLTWKLWPGMKHELHNEVNKAAVLEFLMDWMEKSI